MEEPSRRRSLTIRTVKAFGSQNTLAGLYDKQVGMSYTVEARSAIWHAGCIAIFYFVVYGAYALGPFAAYVILDSYTQYGCSDFFGTTLIGEGHGKYNASTNQSSILTLIFSYCWQCGHYRHGHHCWIRFACRISPGNAR